MIIYGQFWIVGLTIKTMTIPLLKIIQFDCLVITNVKIHQNERYNLFISKKKIKLIEPFFTRFRSRNIGIDHGFRGNVSCPIWNAINARMSRFWKHFYMDKRYSKICCKIWCCCSWIHQLHEKISRHIMCYRMDKIFTWIWRKAYLLSTLSCEMCILPGIMIFLKG